MDKYEELRLILDTHPSGAPRSSAFDAILRILFTDEESALAVHMSFKTKSPDEIAKSAGLKRHVAERLLEGMADKAVIFCMNKSGEKQYGLLPTIPGLFEFPFMKGPVNPEHERLSALWYQYHEEALGDAFCGDPTPAMRVVPVGESMSSELHVHPYDVAAELVESAGYRAVTKCACRVSVAKCDAPLEVCLIFGTTAKFLVERGYAREITKQEAMDVLKQSDEAGLVHTSNNSADKAGLICNCCPCCCTVLRGLTVLNNPHAFATSAYIARVDGEKCTGCGVCIEERCPMQAIELNDEKAGVLDEKCIGCGLCVTGCPAEAVRMAPRPSRPPITESFREMGLKMVQEKGKLEKFIEVMSK